MWFDFFLENAHFAVNIGAAGIFFAIFWLYADAWMTRKTARELLKLAGFFLLVVSFIIHATRVESAIISSALLGMYANDLVAQMIKLLGYLLLILALALEPLQDRPTHRTVNLNLLVLSAPGFIANATVAPILAAIVGLLYMRRATTGLEYHTRRVAIAFFLLSLYELTGLPIILLADTTNSDVYPLVAPFGVLWIVHHLILCAAMFLLASWVFSYLLKRFQTQLFIFFTTAVLGIFLITTVTFTGLLVSNLEKETLRQLETDARVLQLALDRTKSQVISDTESFAQNPSVLQAIPAVSRKPLSDLAENFLLSKKQSTLVIVNETGRVITRGEDRERIGEALGQNPLIKQALAGESTASLITKEGIVASDMFIYAASPIKSGTTLLGAVLMGVSVDSAFVDGIKDATGLESSIYAGDQISATTLAAADGISRLVGIKEHHAPVLSQVLKDAAPYTGSVTLLSRPYLAAYLPLVDNDRVPIGMIFVGKPQAGVIQTAARSIEVTFIVTAVLIALSIVPSFLISKSLAGQVR